MVTSDPPLMMGAFLIPPPLVDKGGSGSRCIRLVGGAAMDTPWVPDQGVAHLQAKGLVRDLTSLYPLFGDLESETMRSVRDLDGAVLLVDVDE